ncbi:hypothetical protein SS50377_21372 [Spironucleus salmonicida]|uniref:Uncharacterized protein n=1 Tax=Spironucleus salmonicida TaxID=348837 RepID=V6LI61_9EUKA|nr:hypothetical protein SS50377_21372 [Spironucleus salmonicida]|eukprot:EST44222.1 Hypothetical protein SS50377_15945 [Spironucleus salmonicida]
MQLGKIVRNKRVEFSSMCKPLVSPRLNTNILQQTKFISFCDFLPDLCDFSISDSSVLSQTEDVFVDVLAFLEFDLSFE